ncbi:DUF817 domain-containing protein [Candidatus Saccharibacteria bacterium]|nr:MAG: DUF817 domain-containing protein [Candidatus Saccharibacteria bacterium]
MTTISRKQQFIAYVRQLPGGVLLTFIIRQAWAALFGGLLLSAIIVTNYVELPYLARYDWLFVIALLIQASMLLFRLEQPREVVTILIFHLVGLAMELFKTSSGIGSWSYPEENTIRLGTVPLFSGFMYAAVGSYIARAWRVLSLRFTHYPPRVWTILLGIVIYGNFFSHHYLPDVRILLFAAIGVLFWRTRVYYTLNLREHSMPILIGFLLIAFFIWIAENIGTYTHTWLYPSQSQIWHIVSFDKLGAWLLLMIISFIMIDCLNYLRTRRS